MRRDRTLGIVLVSTLALSKADGALIGVVAPSLRAQFHLSDAGLGLLASLASVTGAVAALPAGTLVDRRHRPVVLAAALALWSVALGVAGLATGFLVLAGARLVSGCVATIARPAAVSFVGDAYDPGRRGRVMAVLDAGQSAGAAVCFLVAAVALHWFSWRMAFWWLAAAGIILAIAARRLAEPAPDGRVPLLGWLAHPSARVPTPAASAQVEGAATPASVVTAGGSATVAPMVGPALNLGAGAGLSRGGDGETIRPADPPGQPEAPPLRQVIVELLQIRTNRVVLLGEAVGNFFYAGVASFAVLFATERFGLPTAEVDSVAPVLALAVVGGLLLGGAAGDRLARRGGGSRRLLLACVLDLVAAVLLVPAVSIRSLPVSIGLLTLAAAILSAGGPCLDAVRIDIVRPEIRGRAEAARSLLTLGASALAPVTFGLVAMSFGGQGADSRGLADAFLVMLLPLAASGVILLAGLRSYDADAAAAETLSFGTK